MLITGRVGGVSVSCCVLLHPFAVVVFGCGGEEGVAAGIEGGLDAVLNHADNESYGDGTHGHIVADAEERACHGDEQQ